MPHDFQKHYYSLKPLENFYFCFINLSLNILQQLEFIPCILNSENSPAQHTGEKQWSKRNSSALRRIYDYLAFLTAISSWFFCGFIFCTHRVLNGSEYQDLLYSEAEQSDSQGRAEAPSRWC